MPTPRHPRKPARRPASRRASSTRRATTDPTRSLDLDATRFLAFRSGVSPAEIAARENSTLAAVEASLARQRILREQFSQESLEHTYRRGAIEAHSAVQSAILQALGASITQIREVGKDENGDPVTEIFSFPDHKTRLAAIEKLSNLVSSIQQQGPLVSIDARTATQNNLTLASGQATTEDIIRAVRVEKGLALTAETGDEQDDTSPLPDSIDFELEADLQKAAEIDPEYLAEPEESEEDD